jgi:outer membrane immunogenic protein
MVGCTNLMGALMRKLFLLGMTTLTAVILGGAAQAADMPVKARPAPAPVMYNWTGFYIGGHIGGAWADRDHNHRFDGDRCIWGGGEWGAVCFEDNRHGRNDGNFIAGGQIGFNYQVGQWVWGVEGQISAVLNDNDDDACGFFTWEGGRDHLFRCRNRGDWVATLALRLGVTFGQTGNWLLYLKGGAAFADAGFDIRLRDDCPLTLTLCNRDNFRFNNNDDTRTGWMIGVGLEYGAWGNWSWKLEYNFMDFGNNDNRFDHVMTSCDCTLRHDIDRDFQVHVVKFGLNYRFGAAPEAAPVAARY